MKVNQSPSAAPMTVEICILAGGLSSRMGRDKARLKLRGKTLLGHVRWVAAETSWPVRVIRRDLVPRCGPLGGVFTALKTTRSDAVLFLACDMPFVTCKLIEKVVKSLQARHRAVFTLGGNGAGFPFLLRQDILPLVEDQIAAKRFSLQALAAKCGAKLMRVPGGERSLFNVNTTEDLERMKDEKKIISDAD